MSAQDMEAARELVDLWRENPVPVSEGVRLLDIATTIAQARVDAERERDEAVEWAQTCGNVLGDALTAGIELGTADPRWASVAKAHLALSPAASLIAHDNALIERWREAADRCLSMVGPLEHGWEFSEGMKEGVSQCRRALRALKTDSEGSPM